MSIGFRVVGRRVHRVQGTLNTPIYWASGARKSSGHGVWGSGRGQLGNGPERVKQVIATLHLTMTVPYSSQNMYMSTLGSMLRV